MGQIYVQVDASTTNEIMALNASGGGQHQGSYWINWVSAGFQGISWYYGDTNLPQTWGYNGVPGNPGPADGYEATEEGFVAYVETLGEGATLDRWLGSWDDSDKLAFIKKHADILMKCVV